MSKKLKIEYRVSPDSPSLAAQTAEHITRSVEKAANERGKARIAISGGSTPQAAFHLLADPAHPWRSRIPWDRLEIFWVDERCVPPDHPDSNYRMTREAMLDHVSLQAGQVHRMEGELEPQVAASRYESLLRDAFRLEGAESPRFDLIQLGMGPDGHTASLFPYTEALHVLSRLVTANHVPQQKQSWRVTLTWPVINSGSSVFFLIAGADKAALVRDVFTGANDPERLPSQLIWPSGGILTLILDQAAAALLPATDGEGCGVFERER